MGVYYNGTIHKDLPHEIDRTWSYAPYLAGRDIQYANLYFGKNRVGAACPDNLNDRWDVVGNKLKAFLRSFKESRVDLNENCFFDLVPERFLLEFCEMKNKITDYVLDNYEKPKNYDFLLELTKVLEEIKYQKLSTDLSILNNRIFDFKTKQVRKKIVNSQPYIKYDIFGTRTGRLTTQKDSFPILTLAKEYRRVILPKNDWLVEFDFNAAELRTLIALSGLEQPPEDLHNWNIQNVFKNQGTREEAKKRVFAWLYNPEAKDRLLDKAYNRNLVVKKYFDGSHVSTFFGREIESDKHHALNYIIQSTTSDLFLDRVIDIFKLLKERKSFVSFFIHDSLVIDFSEDDKEILVKIKEIFSDTKLGKFKVNIAAGRNFGSMKKLKI